MTLYSRKNLSVLSACITLFVAGILMLTTRPALANETALRLEGVWFTCEFARSQTPPDDGCLMFDDEGFKAREGELSYLRMIGSAETNCKGQKQGQCFPADLPQITVKTTPIGDVWLDTDQLYVTWYGCTQN